MLDSTLIPTKKIPNQRWGKDIFIDAKAERILQWHYESIKGNPSGVRELIPDGNINKNRGIKQATKYGSYSSGLELYPLVEDKMLPPPKLTTKTDKTDPKQRGKKPILVQHKGNKGMQHSERYYTGNPAELWVRTGGECVFPTAFGLQGFRETVAGFEDPSLRCRGQSSVNLECGVTAASRGLMSDGHILDSWRAQRVNTSPTVKVQL